MATAWDHSTTAGSNSAVGGVDIAEGTMVVKATNNMGRAILADFANALKAQGGAYTTAGTGSAYTLTLDIAPTAYSESMLFLVKFHAVSALTTATINVNALGAKTIVQWDGSALPSAAHIPVNSYGFIKYDGTNFRLFIPRNTFSGARVSLSANQTIPDATSTTVSWGTEDEDEGGWWVIGSPTRLTVPAGVARVRLIAGAQWEAVAAGARHVEFRKNSAAVAGAGASLMPGVVNGTIQTITSAWLTVTAGDFFEVRVFHTRGGGVALDLLDSDATFFAIEAYPG